jgi:uncharacterized membrane-anchored protein
VSPRRRGRAPGTSHPADPSAGARPADVPGGDAGELAADGAHVTSGERAANGRPGSAEARPPSRPLVPAPTPPDDTLDELLREVAAEEERDGRGSGWGAGGERGSARGGEPGDGGHDARTIAGDEGGRDADARAFAGDGAGLAADARTGDHDGRLADRPGRDDADGRLADRGGRDDADGRAGERVGREAAGGPVATGGPVAAGAAADAMAAAVTAAVVTEAAGAVEATAAAVRTADARAGRRRRWPWRRSGTPEPTITTGVARVDTRTKRLVKRLVPGEVAVIDHADLDRVAAETLVDAAPAAVVNVATSITGRYPNLGPLLLCQAGIPLIDGVGPDVLGAVRDGDPVAIDGGDVIVGGDVVASGTPQTVETLGAAIDEARRNMGPELERFAENTVEYVRQEIAVLTGDVHVPDVAIDMAGRQALIVVRGIDYKDDLQLLRRSGYLKEVRPVLIGVDGGADALLGIGYVPDLIIGDFDSVNESTLRCGAQLIVHGYGDGRAPGAERLDELGLPYTVFSAPGTSEDVAMLLAYEHGAELLVAVGTHSSMVEFLDKGRAGMASTFLVRMKVGSALVDAKGVSRLYRHSVRSIDLFLLVVAAVFTLAVVFALSEPMRLVVRALWLTLTG